MKPLKHNSIVRNLQLIKLLTISLIFVFVSAISYLVYKAFPNDETEISAEKETTENVAAITPWTAPSDWRLDKNPNKEQILYGKELLTNTAKYIGFNGIIEKNTNGLNCQNCHLKAGKQPFGNNMLGVAANYPKISKRSGKQSGIYERVNGCIQRSLNGHALDSTNKEMKAMIAYIKWIGQDVPKGITPEGAKMPEIDFLKRAANPEKGEVVYNTKCQSCHQADGQGVINPDGRTYTYPPLWGKHAYNDGAGLYRLSRFAGYVRYNMPFGATYERPQLTDEEAWDLAAFVNSKPRPIKEKSKDWPNLADKPIDHPFGPFADSFSETQHKYGPFEPIKKYYSKK